MISFNKSFENIKIKSTKKNSSTVICKFDGKYVVTLSNVKLSLKKDKTVFYITSLSEDVANEYSNAEHFIQNAVNEFEMADINSVFKDSNLNKIKIKLKEEHEIESATDKYFDIKLKLLASRLTMSLSETVWELIDVVESKIDQSIEEEETLSPEVKLMAAEALALIDSDADNDGPDDMDILSDLYSDLLNTLTQKKNYVDGLISQLVTSSVNFDLIDDISNKIKLL